MQLLEQVAAEDRPAFWPVAWEEVVQVLVEELSLLVSSDCP